MKKKEPYFEDAMNAIHDYQNAFSQLWADVTAESDREMADAPPTQVRTMAHPVEAGPSSEGRGSLQGYLLQLRRLKKTVTSLVIPTVPTYK